MPTSSFTARIVLAAFATTLAGSARADACEALLGAMIKLAGTPHRLYATQTTPLLGNKPRETQSVVADKAMWVLASSGKWHVLPYDMPAAIEKARSMPDAHACQRVRDEPVNGEAASLFTVRSKTEFGTVDSQIWVSASRGLPLRQITDVSEGQTHTVGRFDYVNVQPPALPR